MVYLDNAATTQVLPQVRQAMDNFMASHCGNPSSMHSHGKAVQAAIDAVRKQIAAMIGADPGEIIFTSGATESNNMVMHTFNQLGKKVWVSAIEHASVLEAIDTKECIPVDREGFVTDVSQCVDGCVSIMHANNEIGTVQDIDMIARTLKRQGNLVHVDAVQSFGKVPLDVRYIPVDYMSISSHKVHGPAGVGVLYVRDGAPLCSLLKGGDQEQGRRAGTENTVGIVGFGAAIKSIQEKKPQVTGLDVFHALQDMCECTLHGPTEQRLWNNCNVRIHGIDAQTLVEHASHQGVSFSTGSACHSHKIEPSHVLKAIGLSDQECSESVRLTTTWTTTKEDLQKAVSILHAVINHLCQVAQ